jgi:outer membrane protein OmpA-like peptidoglycan-associated protein
MKTYDLDPKLVHFDTDSVKLVKSSDQYFKRLAKALADNHHLFSRVDVIGHADQRGPDSYNDKLSFRRAKAMSDKLVAAGVRTSQIAVEGKGESQLLTHSMKPLALEKNRRVQLQFQGVQNAQALQNIIDSVAR